MVCRINRCNITTLSNIDVHLLWRVISLCHVLLDCVWLSRFVVVPCVAVICLVESVPWVVTWYLTAEDYCCFQSSVFAGFALKAPASSSFKPDPSHGLLSNSAALSNTRSIVASNGANDTVEDTEDTIDDDTSFAGSPAYLQQLRQLNEAILAWVERHVKHSPYCIFTPSFDDYNRHLQDLRNEWCARGTPLSACITSAADDHTPVTSVDRCPLPQTTKTPSAEFSFSIGSSASKTGFKFDQCFSSSLQKECVSGEGGQQVSCLYKLLIIKQIS